MKQVLGVFLLLTLSSPAYTQQSIRPAAAHQVSAKSFRQLDSLFHYLDTSGLYNGNILVAAEGKKVAAASIGYANLTTQEHLTDQSVFTLASVSKQFTAVGVLRLVDAGKLKLDQRVETIIPAFPYQEITIRHLLNHTGGLPSYERLLQQHWDTTRIATNKDVVALFIKLHPAASFSPGTQWEYSNTGYVLLGYIIEQLSGKSYAAYMQDQVFTPLNLSHTSVYMPRFAPRQIPGFAYGYVRDAADRYQLPDSLSDYNYVRYLDGIAGQGRVASTVGDLLLWNNAVRDQKLLSPALWKTAETAPTINGTSTDYGFGFQLTSNPTRGKVLMHIGGWPGYNTRNVIYLNKNVSLIYLSNMEQNEAIITKTWTAVKDIVFGLPVTFPTPLKQLEASIDAATLRSYPGTYESTEMPGFELKVRVDGTHVFAVATGQPEIELAPESGTRFFLKGSEIVVEFKPNGTQPASSLILHQNGVHPFNRK